MRNIVFRRTLTWQGCARARKRFVMTKDSDSYVRAIARGFEVIDTLGRSPGRHTLSEVAASAGLNRATARRILLTLASLEYCETDGRYFKLKPRVLSLGVAYLHALPYWGFAHRVLEDLRAEVKESCALAVLDNTDIVYLMRQPSRRILSTHLGIGSRLPAHLVSLGRVMLAYLPAAERDARLETLDLQRVTPKTIAGKRRLKAELQATAERGYAWVDGELDPAICGLAVPVRDADGQVHAALSVNTISGTLDMREAKARFLVPLQRAAQEIRAYNAFT